MPVVSAERAAAEQFTATSHWDNKVSEQLLRGDGFTWIRRRMNGSVAALQPLPWGAVQPWRMPDGSVRYYITMPDFGVTTWLTTPTYCTSQATALTACDP